MTTALRPHRLRFACNMDSRASLIDALTNVAAQIWRGTTVQVEIGCFVGTDILTDKTNLTALYLEIHTADRSNSPLVQKEVLAANVAINVTAEQWTAGTSQNCTITLTPSETQLPLTGGNDNSNTFWLVIHAVTTTGQRITLGGGPLTVIEDGAQNDLSVVPLSAPSFRILDGDLQLYNKTTGLFHAVWLEGEAGAERIVWAQGA